MIYPTQSHILADWRTLSTAKFVHSTSHKVYSVFDPVWNHAYDSTNRFPPDGYILSDIFLVLSFMAMFITMYGAYKSILKSKKTRNLDHSATTIEPKVCTTTQTAFQSEESVTPFGDIIDLFLEIIFVVDNAASVHIMNESILKDSSLHVFMSCECSDLLMF